MEALKQAAQSTAPVRPSDPSTFRQGLQPHDIPKQRTHLPLSQDAVQMHSLNSDGLLHHGPAVTKSFIGTGLGANLRPDEGQPMLETSCNELRRSISREEWD